MVFLEKSRKGILSVGLFALAINSSVLEGVKGLPGEGAPVRMWKSTPFKRTNMCSPLQDKIFNVFKNVVYQPREMNCDSTWNIWWIEFTAFCYPVPAWKWFLIFNNIMGDLICRDDNFVRAHAKRNDLDSFWACVSFDQLRQQAWMLTWAGFVGFKNFKFTFSSLTWRCQSIQKSPQQQLCCALLQPQISLKSVMMRISRECFF